MVSTILAGMAGCAAGCIAGDSAGAVWRIMFWDLGAFAYGDVCDSHASANELALGVNSDLACNQHRFGRADTGCEATWHRSYHWLPCCIGAWLCHVCVAGDCLSASRSLPPLRSIYEPNYKE